MASDHGSSMKIEKLNVNNFISWKFNMKCLLMEKGLWGFVTGTAVKPEVKTENADVNADAVGKSREKLDEYNLKSDKAYSLIALSVEKDLQIHVSTKSTAKEAWESLKSQFEFVSVTQLVRLNRRFYAAKLEEGGDLMKHITEMTTLAEQLREMKEDISSKKFAVAILGSLPDSYDNFLTSMNARDAEKLDWSSVQGVLMEEHAKRAEKDKNKTDDEALFAGRNDNSWRGGHNNYRGGPSNRGGSSNRGGRGGFSNRGGRGNFRGQVRQTPYRFTGTCFRCNVTGHRAHECPNNATAQPEEEASVAETDFFHEDDIALIAECDDFANEGEVCPVSEDAGNGDENKVGYSETEEKSVCNESVTAKTTNSGDEGTVSTVSELSDDNDCEIVMVSDCKAEPDEAKNTHEWCVDSGASKHMTHNETILSNIEYYEEPQPVYLGDKSVVLAHAEGQLRLRTLCEDGTCLALKKVLYVPKLMKNLLSVRIMTQRGAEVRFTGDKCIVIKDGRAVEIGRSINGGLYKLQSPAVKPLSEKKETACLATDGSLSLWHQRYGHLNMNDISKLSKSDVVVGLKATNYDKIVDCESCALGKMHRLPYPRQSASRAEVAHKLIHTDLCGPMQVESVGGSRYLLTFTDDFSRYSVVYFLKRKSEVLVKFKEFVNYIENNNHRVEELNVVNSIRSDNGGEYTSKEFELYCKKKGISRQFTNPYCPQQNGVSERLNRTIIEGARSMLFHASLPLKFWAEAVSTMIYLRNRSPTTSLEGKTPYEYYFGKKPDVSNLRVFGCICFVHIPDQLRRKLDPKSYPAVFVGYSNDSKGYKVYNIRTGEFARSRNIEFHENKYHDFEVKYENIDHLTVPVDEETCKSTSNIDLCEKNDNSSAMDDAMNEPVIQEHELAPVNEPIVETNESSIVVGAKATAVENGQQLNNSQSQVVEGREGTEPEHNNQVLKTFEETFMRQVENLGGKRQRKPPERMIENVNIADDECNIVESLTANLNEPKSFKDALNSPDSQKWDHALKSEYESLMKNDTWSLVPRPKNVNVVGNRWVFKVKRKSDGSIDRHKARLVAQGFTQTHNVDYGEVFSPVARMAAIRSLLAFANAQDLEIHQMDVNTAFLNGELDYEVYMEQPEGFVDMKNPEFVCKLNKSLYGLKQSARCWNSTLDTYLKENGYRQSDADSCLYIKSIKSSDGHIKFVILAVFVDDFIPVSNDLEMLQREKAAFSERFDMEDKGEIHDVLGLMVTRDRERRILTISQPDFTKNVLLRFGMENSKPVATPMDPGSVFCKFEEGDKAFDRQKYQQAIGCLTYAAMSTRPDISAAVNVLSHFMSCPNEQHWTGVKRIMRYLKGTVSYGLCFSGNNGVNLVGYSDADWAGDLDTRRSTSGYVFKLGGAIVNWCSKRQATVARSSTESEYVALSAAAQECIWLRRLLQDFGLGDNKPTTLFEDNTGAIELSKNPKFHNRTKHIDVAHHFTRERVISNELSVVHCPTEDMVADVMTKGLGRVKFEKFRDAMGVTCVQ